MKSIILYIDKFEARNNKEHYFVLMIFIIIKNKAKQMRLPREEGKYKHSQKILVIKFRNVIFS